MRPTLIALAALLAASTPQAQEAPPDLALGPEDAQNFAADTSGALRIVGDKARYDIILPADILFDFDRYDLRPDARPLLDQLRAHFATVEPDQLHVRGHTDSKGSDEYNLTLSINRAAAVCDWLRAEAGVGLTNCMGFGEREPLVPNEDPDGTDNPENRQLNRRVTLSVVVYPDTDAMMDQASAQAREALGTLEDPDAGAAALDVGAMLDEAEAQAREALEALDAGGAGGGG